jgi:hypothetical protein
VAPGRLRASSAAWPDGYPHRVITAAALVSHPPLLVRELGGAADPVAALRAAALDAVRGVLAGADEVVVVGPAERPGQWSGGGLGGFGRTVRGSGAPVPLALAVGARLLDGAGWAGPRELVTAPANEDVADLAARLADRPGRTALLLMADGSTRRGERAPGYLDERAFPFDDALAQALATGDAAALVGLDVALAEELMVTGAVTLRLLGAVALGRRTQASLGYRDDPYGVTYVVAGWSFSPDLAADLPMEN